MISFFWTFNSLTVDAAHVYQLESSSSRSWSSFSVNHSQSMSRPSPTGVRGAGPRAPTTFVPRGVPTHSESVNYHHNARPMVVVRGGATPGVGGAGGVNGSPAQRYHPPPLGVSGAGGSATPNPQHRIAEGGWSVGLEIILVLC